MKMKTPSKRDRLRMRALFGPMPKTIKKPLEPLAYEKGEATAIDFARFKHLDGFDLRAAISDKEVMDEFEKIHEAKIKRLLNTPAKKHISFPKRKRLETLILLAEVKKRVDVRRERADKFREIHGTTYLNADGRAVA